MENPFASIALIFVLVIGCIFGGLYGCPQYGVYSQRLEGEALLAHSIAAKEVAVSEAKAKFEAATMLAQAEVERAKGVAQANQIIGESLRNNESYLRYLWINNLEANNPTVIYVPTEANMPILESGRLNHLSSPPPEAKK